MKPLLLILTLCTSLVFAIEPSDNDTPANQVVSKTSETRSAIAAIYPTLIVGRDYTLDRATGEIVAWKASKRFLQPTTQQLAAAKTEVAAQAAIVASVHAGLLAEYQALAPGERAFYRPIYNEVKSLIAAGRLAEVREVIATAPTPTEALAAARDRMVALFPE